MTKRRLGFLLSVFTVILGILLVLSPAQAEKLLGSDSTLRSYEINLLIFLCLFFFAIYFRSIFIFVLCSLQFASILIVTVVPTGLTYAVEHQWDWIGLINKTTACADGACAHGKIIYRIGWGDGQCSNFLIYDNNGFFYRHNNRAYMSSYIASVTGLNQGYSLDYYIFYDRAVSVIACAV